eukprot:9764451-Karenia_brevis.AAC.1
MRIRETLLQRSVIPPDPLLRLHMQESIPKGTWECTYSERQGLSPREPTQWVFLTGYSAIPGRD